MVLSFDLMDNLIGVWCGEDSKTYNKLSSVYEYNIHHHIRNKLSLSINVILKPREETNHLSLTSH